MSDPATKPVPEAVNRSKAKQRAMPTRKEKQDISIMEVCASNFSLQVLVLIPCVDKQQLYHLETKCRENLPQGRSWLPTLLRQEVSAPVTPDQSRLLAADEGD